MVQCDWLQMTFKNKYGEFKIGSGYELKDTGKRAPNWNKVYKLYQRAKNIETDGYTAPEQIIATICSEPTSQFIDQKLNIIKFENSLLYLTSFHVIGQNIFNVNSFEFHNISRIDISYDFQTFETLSPTDLIHGFLNGTIKKTDKCKFALNGMVDGKMNPQYIRWGSPSSEVSYYLYNKTQELKDVKDKPYIREHWKMAGLDTTKSVWRLEFRVSSTNLTAVRPSTGEASKVCKMGFEVLSKKPLQEIFLALRDKYFDFRYSDGSATSNTTRLQPVKLFNVKSYDYVLRNVANKLGSNKMDKLAIKMLCEVNEWLKDYDQDFHDHATKMLTQLIGMKINFHNLQQWAEHRNYIPNEAINS